MSVITVGVDVSAAKAAIARRLQKLLAVPVAVAETAREAEMRLQMLTPRSKEADPHMADMWKATISLGGTSGKAPTAVIDHPFNVEGATHPRTGAEMNDGKRSVLTDLEYGTTPHIIEPKQPGGMLRFKGIGGAMVSTKLVHHPGTRPRAMVRTVRDETARAFRARMMELLK